MKLEKILNELEKNKFIKVKRKSLYVDILYKGVRVHTLIVYNKYLHEYMALKAVLECVKRGDIEVLLDTCDIEDILAVGATCASADVSIPMCARREFLTN